MKFIILFLGLASVAHADQALNSFGTGFANGLQRALEARQEGEYPKVEPTYQVPQQPYSRRIQWCRVTNGGDVMSCYSSLQSCQTMADSIGGECVGL